MPPTVPTNHCAVLETNKIEPHVLFCYFMLMHSSTDLWVPIPFLASDAWRHTDSAGTECRVERGSTFFSGSLSPLPPPNGLTTPISTMAII